MSKPTGPVGLPRRDRQMRPMPERPAMDVPMKRFEEKAGLPMIESLVAEQTDSKFIALLGMMQDAKYAKWSFAAKAKAVDVSLHELQGIYANAQTQMALMEMSSRLPEVAADIAEDALSVMVECPPCAGKGAVGASDDERECVPCGGSGKVRQAGNKHARDLMFQAGGIIGNGKMTMAAGTQIQLGADMDMGIEALLKVTTGIVMKVGS